MRTLFPVYFLFEERTRLEGEDLAGGNGERFAGLGISPCPVALLLDDKLAEAGEFYFFTGGQRFLYDVQYGLHNLFGFFSLKVAVGSNVFYQFFFCHRKDFYHKRQGKGKRETSEGPLLTTGLPEDALKLYFFLAAGFFFFACTAS